MVGRRNESDWRYKLNNEKRKNEPWRVSPVTGYRWSSWEIWREYPIRMLYSLVRRRRRRLREPFQSKALDVFGPCRVGWEKRHFQRPALQPPVGCGRERGLVERQSPEWNNQGIAIVRWRTEWVEGRTGRARAKGCHTWRITVSLLAPASPCTPYTRLRCHTEAAAYSFWLSVFSLVFALPSLVFYITRERKWAGCDKSESGFEFNMPFHHLTHLLSFKITYLWIILNHHNTLLLFHPNRQNFKFDFYLFYNCKFDPII